jgi:hypothetical protein
MTYALPRLEDRSVIIPKAAGSVESLDRLDQGIS